MRDGEDPQLLVLTAKQRRSIALHAELCSLLYAHLMNWFASIWVRYSGVVFMDSSTAQVRLERVRVRQHHYVICTYTFHKHAKGLSNDSEIRELQRLHRWLWGIGHAFSPARTRLDQEERSEWALTAPHNGGAVRVGELATPTSPSHAAYSR